MSSLIATEPSGATRLDARRLVRRRADHRVALGAHLGRDVADEHETGVDPDPRRELDPVLAPDGRVEVLERGEQLEAREHRLTGVVLTRRGKAEVGHDAVALVLREVTVMLGDDPAAPLAVVLEQVADLLGLVALRHRRGSDEVDEHHRELAALAAVVVPVALDARATVRARFACGVSVTFAALLRRPDGGLDEPDRVGDGTADLGRGDVTLVDDGPLPRFLREARRRHRHHEGVDPGGKDERF